MFAPAGKPEAYRFRLTRQPGPMAQGLGKYWPDMVRMKLRNDCALPRSDAEGHSIPERGPRC